MGFYRADQAERSVVPARKRACENGLMERARAEPFLDFSIDDAATVSRAQWYTTATVD